MIWASNSFSYRGQFSISTPRRGFPETTNIRNGRRAFIPLKDRSILRCAKPRSYLSLPTGCISVTSAMKMAGVSLYASQGGRRGMHEHALAGSTDSRSKSAARNMILFLITDLVHPVLVTCSGIVVSWKQESNPMTRLETTHHCLSQTLQLRQSVLSINLRRLP